MSPLSFLAALVAAVAVAASVRRHLHPHPAMLAATVSGAAALAVAGLPAGVAGALACVALAELALLRLDGRVAEAAGIGTAALAAFLSAPVGAALAGLVAARAPHARTGAFAILAVLASAPLSGELTSASAAIGVVTWALAWGVARHAPFPPVPPIRAGGSSIAGGAAAGVLAFLVWDRARAGGSALPLLDIMALLAAAIAGAIIGVAAFGMLSSLATRNSLRAVLLALTAGGVAVLLLSRPAGAGILLLVAAYAVGMGTTRIAQASRWRRGGPRNPRPKRH